MTTKLWVLVGTAFYLAYLPASAEPGPELNAMLEANAVAAAYARMCNEEPMAEQIKVDTMLVLAGSGLPAHNVQLGSAKFNYLMRQEFDKTKRASDVNCPERVADARARLAETHAIIEAARK